jgi:EAL domain-containing protein (putative c-di-GMP-specific phosphodiesterase class I)
MAAMGRASRSGARSRGALSLPILSGLAASSSRAIDLSRRKARVVRCELHIDRSQLRRLACAPKWGRAAELFKLFHRRAATDLKRRLGLISQLGDQLLEKACIEAKTWPSEIFLAFNISGVQLRDPTAGSRILSILAQTGFDPRRLELEITETVLVKSTDVAQKIINELRAKGVNIALDDFGTGYATLTQLTSLHFDKIKIDRSFVERLGNDPESLVIVAAIVGLAKGFGLTTVGEGIELEHQRACLEENGCSEGQGYLFSKAVPAAAVAPRLRLQAGAPIAA